MKKIIALLTTSLFLGLAVPAQKKIFLRIYDKNDRKFAKGFFAGTTDSSLLLKSRGGVKKEILAYTIGNIKTKRAPGNNIATAAVIGILPGVTAGALFADDLSDKSDNYTTGQGIIGGAMVGAGFCALLGVGVSILKNKDVYLIENKPERWLSVKTILERQSQVQKKKSY